MSRFLRFCAFLSVLFFTTNVFAAGYSCPTYKKYTSCNAGYYMTNSSGTYNGTPAVGNSCTICPKGYYCTGTTANKVACPAGRYGSTTGLKTSTCTGVISAGRYGAAGATSASGSGAVSAGYYSTGGGTSATPTATGNGCISGYTCGKVSQGCYTSGTGSTKACPNSCVANATTSSTGATSVSSCICKAGYGGNAASTTGTCTACEAGYYKSSAGNTSCSAAGTGYYVSSTASTTRSACTSWRANTSTTGTTSTSTSQCLCKAGYYLNGSTCTACSAGSYKSAVSNATSCTTAGSGYYVSTTGATSQSACTSWRANTNTNGATGSTSTDACVCKAGTYLNGSTCTSCSAGTYKSANSNATSCTSCTTASGWTTTTSSTGSTAYTACYQTQTPTNCASGTIKRTASSISGTTITYGTASVTSALSSKPGYHVSGTSCTVCGNGTFYGGGTATSCTSCPTLTSGYSYVSGTGWDAYGDCKETKAYSSVSSNCYSGALTKTATSATAWGTAVSTLTAKGGYKVSGSGDSTTCSACGYGSYSSNGNDTTCDACPTADSGWTMTTTSNVATGYSACYEYKSGTNISSYCSAGQLRRAASSASAYSTSVTISTALQAKAGAYVNGQTCTQCGAGKYSAGGTATSCTNVKAGCYADAAGSSAECPKTCPGLYVNSAAGSDSINDCYFTTTGGYYISASDATSQTKCEAKYYCPATTLYYPNTGSKQSCPDPTSSTYKETLAEMDWLTERCPTATTSNSSLTASNYQTWSNTGLSAITQCPATMTVSTPCANFSIESAKYDSTTGHYNSDVGSVYTSNVKAGYYLQTIYSSTYCNTSTNRMLYRKAVVCPAGSYCPGGSVPQCSSGTYNDTWGANLCTSLGSFYTTSSAGATAATSCSGKTTAGNFIETENAGQVTCTTGGYCPGDVTVAYGSTGGRTGCGAGKYNASTGSSSSSACANITAGCYGTSASSACPAVCAANKWSAAGASSCSSCPTDYENSGDTAASHANQSSCKITVDGGYYIGTAGDNSSNWDKCSAGYYKAAHSVAYGSTSSCAACGAVNKYSSSGASACSTVSTGYYTTGGTTTTRTGQSQCTSGTYCTGGEQKTCPSGYGASAAGSDAAADCYMSVAATKYVKAANDASATACGTGTYKAAHTVYYGGTSTCNSCPSGYDDGAAVATEAECTISVAGGKYVASKNATSATSCSCGTYKAAHTVAYGSTSSCATTSAGYYAAEGAATQTKADAGYYAAAGACDQTVLNNGCWGAAGASTACPNNCNALTAPAVTGGTFSSVTPRSANTSCRYVAPSKTATGCSSITANTVSYSGSAWGTNFYTTKASKGYRVSATGNTSAPACTACACGTYQGTDGSTATSCTTTSAGYYAAEGAATQTQASAGYYAAAGACDQTKIQAGCFGGEGSASACPNSCPAAESGWTLASTTGLKVVTDCAEITTPSTSGSPIATICTAGTLTKKATNATTWGSATASGLTAKAGRYVNGTTCSACAAGTYTSSATTATSCTPAATGYYVSGTEATSQTACPAGTYQGSTGKTSCSDAVAGTYTTGCKDTTNNKACTGTSVCSNGTYSDQKASSCTACTTAKGYTNSGTTAASHAGAASCKVTCGAGQYVASAGAGCVNVGVDTTTNTGYWGAGGTVSQTATLARNKCDTGLITTGSGTGANEAADCGRKLHAGDNVIYLRSESRTTPALRVKVGDKTFFGALSTTLSGALKVKNGSTEYSVVNDYQ